MELEILGAIKIKDGLFIGDEFAAQDLEFLVANKVTHIINCGARQIPNHWEPIGVQYLSYYWLDHDSQIIFDLKDQVLNDIYNFIEKAISVGESVLVHSIKGQSRACSVVVAFLMRKFKWTLFKTLEFMNSRRPDLEIRASFIHQLAALENRLSKAGLAAKTSKWTELSDEYDINSEELLLRNTYLNSLMGNNQQDFQRQSQELSKISKSQKINWSDHNTNDAKKLTNFPHFQSRNPVQNGCAVIKSCLKGSKQQEVFVPLKHVSQSLAQKIKEQDGIQPYKSIQSQSTSVSQSQNHSYTSQEIQSQLGLGQNNQHNNSDQSKQIKKIRPPSPAQQIQTKAVVNNQFQNQNQQFQQQTTQQQIQRILQQQQQQAQYQQQQKMQQQQSLQSQYLNQGDSQNIKKAYIQQQQQPQNNQYQQQTQSASQQTSSYLKNIQQQSQLQRIQQQIMQETTAYKKEQQQLQNQVRQSAQTITHYINSYQNSQIQQSGINNQQPLSSPQVINNIKQQNLISKNINNFQNDQNQNQQLQSKDKNQQSEQIEEMNLGNHTPQSNMPQSATYTSLQKKGPSYKRDFTPLLKSRQQQEHRIQQVRPESAPRSMRGEPVQKQIQRQAQTPSRANEKQNRPFAITQNSHNLPLQRPLNGNLTSSYEIEQKKRTPVKATIDILQKNKLKQQQQNQNNSAKNKGAQGQIDQGLTEKKVIVRPQTATNVRPPSPTPGIKYSLNQQNLDRKQKMASFQSQNPQRSISTSQAAMRQFSPLGRKNL